MNIHEAMKKLFWNPLAEKQLKEALEKPYTPVKPGEPFQIVSTPTGDNSGPFVGLDLGRKLGDETVWAFQNPETGEFEFRKDLKDD